MKQPLFTGVCTALVTPFTGNKVNYRMLDCLIERQIKAGVKAIVLAGTTGEAPTLADEEKYDMIHHAKAFVGNECRIIAGTGTNSTQHAIELSQSAESAGADGLLVVSPYYNKGNPDGLFRHFSAIACSVKLPVIVYNVPTRTGVDVPVSVYRQLTEKSNIIGVKEASSDITKISKIRASCGDGLHIWSGNDDQIVPVMALGGLGVVSVLSNVCPDETVAMVQAAQDGDYRTASALQIKMMPLINALFSEVNPIPVKYAMKCIGFDCGNCRLPLGKLSRTNCEHLESLLS